MVHPQLLLLAVVGEGDHPPGAGCRKIAASDYPGSFIASSTTDSYFASEFMVSGVPFLSKSLAESIFLADLHQLWH